MEWYEAAFDRFYPILYSHRDADEALHAVETFERFFDDGAPILDMASGDGRYLGALRTAGYKAYGLDLSHYLLLRAVEDEDNKGSVVQGDMRSLPFVSDAFGTVINMFTSFGYFSVDTDNLLVFREVKRVLRDGGIFLFDFLNASRISTSLLGETRRESMGYDIHERRAVEGHGKYLVKHATITDRSNKTESIEERLRLYSKRDLTLMFESVALEIVDCFGDYNGNEFVEGVSERVIFVCRNG